MKTTEDGSIVILEEKDKLNSKIPGLAGFKISCRDQEKACLIFFQKGNKYTILKNRGEIKAI